MKYVVQFSAGLSSWQSAERIAGKHGTDNLQLLFCDTIIEDEDAYRFLIEASAHVFGIRSPQLQKLRERAAKLPLIEDGRLEERKAELCELRVEMKGLVPKLNWIADGRTPWEVFRDERFLGNSRLDPCSKKLKRQLADAWHRKNCDPSDTRIIFGLLHSEQKRIAKVSKRLSAVGWTPEFPLNDPPLMSRSSLMQAALDAGIQPPRLYFYGFPHNNCGGWCCKSGHGSLGRLLQVLPNRFRYHEQRESEFQEFIGKPVTMLRQTTAGVRSSLSLQVLRQRIECGGNIDWSDRGACSCFESDDEETVEAETAGAA